MILKVVHNFDIDLELYILLTSLIKFIKVGPALLTRFHIIDGDKYDSCHNKDRSNQTIQSNVFV